MNPMGKKSRKIIALRSQLVIAQLALKKITEYASSESWRIAQNALDEMHLARKKTERGE